MSNLRWTWMSLLGLALLTGCESTAKREVWQARLRDSQDQVYRLSKKVDELEEELALKMAESDDLRLQLTAEGETPLQAEQAKALYKVTGIKINHLLTGGLDHDGEPGDEALSLLLSPHDEDGTLVKLPGELMIEIIDHSRPESEEVIGEWKFSPQQMKLHWHAGFIGVGYLFDLNWQELPHQEELLVHARLETGDDRQFDITEKIRIVPPISNQTTRFAESKESDRFKTMSGDLPSTRRLKLDAPPLSRPLRPDEPPVFINRLAPLRKINLPRSRFLWSYRRRFQTSKKSLNSRSPVSRNPNLKNLAFCNFRGRTPIAEPSLKIFYPSEIIRLELKATGYRLWNNPESTCAEQTRRLGV
ncbi:MAG: hypothetical protein R3C11_03830 [Planctomycetaceae bacterium]